MIVFVITWLVNGVSHEQAYGPWTVREGWPHLDEIAAFQKRWIARNGPWIRATMYLVESPESVVE